MQTEDRLRPEDLTNKEALAEAESLIRQVQKRTDNIFIKGPLQRAREHVLDAYAKV